MPTSLIENAPEAPLKAHERAGLLLIIYLRRSVLVCLVAVLPITLITALIAPRLLVPAIALCLATFVISILRHSLAHCPRCGDFFNWMNPMTRECIACGLSLDKLQTDKENVDFQQ